MDSQLRVTVTEHTAWAPIGMRNASMVEASKSSQLVGRRPARGLLVVLSCRLLVCVGLWIQLRAIAFHYLGALLTGAGAHGRYMIDTVEP